MRATGTSCSGSGATLQPRPCALRGFRERRDQALAEEARRLAEAVRADGQPREMAPLNAYERRVVHVALQAEPGVTTFSVGEGSSRRVTVAPLAPGGPGTEAPDGGQ
jgi:spoIIIJ-associated protein